MYIWDIDSKICAEEQEGIETFKMITTFLSNNTGPKFNWPLIVTRNCISAARTSHSNYCADKYLGNNDERKTSRDYDILTSIISHNLIRLRISRNDYRSTFWLGVKQNKMHWRTLLHYSMKVERFVMYCRNFFILCNQKCRIHIVDIYSRRNSIDRESYMINLIIRLRVFSGPQTERLKKYLNPFTHTGLLHFIAAVLQVRLQRIRNSTE